MREDICALVISDTKQIHLPLYFVLIFAFMYLVGYLYLVAIQFVLHMCLYSFLIMTCELCDFVYLHGFMLVGMAFAFCVVVFHSRAVVLRCHEFVRVHSVAGTRRFPALPYSVCLTRVSRCMCYCA